MLLVNARNIWTDADDNATYAVSVLVNTTPIWNGEVSHNRADGAHGLLRVIADHMERERKLA